MIIIIHDKKHFYICDANGKTVAGPFRTKEQAQLWLQQHGWQ